MKSVSMPRAAAIMAALTALVFTLAACTLTPAYQNRGAVVLDRLSWAEPGNREAQIVLNALKRRFGDGGTAAPYTASVSASTSGQRISKIDGDDPAELYEMKITGTLTIRDAVTGETVLSESRNASAQYTSGPQSSANRANTEDAKERAAARLAEVLSARLLIFLNNS
jgi:LPS-assembly lipoprotein